MQLAELLEDFRMVYPRGSQRSIDHVDPDAVAPAAHSDENSALPGVAQRIFDQIAKNALQQRGVGARIQRPRTERN